MRNVAILGSGVRQAMPDNDSIESVELKGVAVTCGIISTRPPAFDPAAPANAFSVLVRVKAFSCNYRDLNFIFSTVRKGGERSFYTIGSDFVGQVVSVGESVESLKAGDRVISNCHYTGGSTGARAAEGVPTNHGSKEYQVLHEDKLIAIPPEMPDAVAAAFSIGAQTSYSMIRRLDIPEGAHVLVTAGRSNTSLFTIGALKKRRVHVYATTTSPRAADQLRALGVEEVFRLDPSHQSFAQDEQMRQTAARIGGFMAVVDPFFDLHLSKAIDVMAAGGKYITCGLHDQYQSLIDSQFQSQQLSCHTIMIKMMTRNIQLIGNCIGLTEDLREAIGDYLGGSLPVLVDSVFTGNQLADFFRRTYDSDDRFGKVVYQYN